MPEKPETADPILQVAQVVSCTEAEGPGRRFALWFQGCPMRCPGCCNPEMLLFGGGKQMTGSEILAHYRQAAAEQGVEGITFLGGEPLAHARGAAAVAAAIRQRSGTVMVFTGYTLAEARQLPDPSVGELLALTDILVDGPYLRELPEQRRRWIGSTNQRVYCLTDRYRLDDPCWQQPNTLELRLSPGRLTVNGFPAPAALGLWKK